MKLLFILPEFYPGEGGGIITFYKNLVLALRPGLSRVKVLVGSGYTQDRLQTIWHDIEVEYLEPDRYQKHLQIFRRFDIIPSFKSNLAAAWAMYEQARGGEGFDLVECNDFGIGYLPWVLRQQLPVIVRLHGSSGQIVYHDPIPDESLAGDFFRQAELLTLRLATGVHTYSPDNQAFWQEQLGCPVMALPPVFPAAHQAPLPYGQRSGKGVVTGRLQFWKGPLTVAKALQTRRLNTVIDWFGRDMHYQDSKKMMSEHLAKHFKTVWQKRLIHHSRVSAAEVSALQAKALFGVVPSGWDMFNMSCLEFMAAGTPVICSQGAGTHYLLEDGVNGFKFRADDETALADKIESLLSLSVMQYEQMSQKALETISLHLSQETLAPVYLDAYRQAVKNFTALPYNAYLSEIYGPDKQEQQLSDLLDRQPLVGLLPYIRKRIIKKLKGE